MAAKLGWDLMPWQRYVLDVALEINPATGRLAYRQVMVTLPRQGGKGLAEFERLPTPTGWVKMGDIKPGQELFDETGAVCRVSFVSDRRILDCYRVHFSDGSSVVADGDHLWRVFDVWSSGGPNPDCAGEYVKGAWRTIATRDMAGTESIGNRAKKESRFRLPPAPQLELPDADLLIDPYVLGAWLADGHSKSAISFHRSTNPGRGVRGQDSGQRRLRELGVLNDKHIPTSYLRASPSQRLALLQGLMDTDGTVAPKGTSGSSRVCEISLCNERLARDVHELLRTFGIRSRWKASPAKLYGRTVGTQYRLQFTTDLPVFRLRRKAEILASGEPRHPKSRTIERIERIPTVPTRCIQVDSPSSLFLAGDAMVPTHNTSLLLVLMVTRCVAWSTPQRIVYTAQKGRDAQEKFEEDYVETLRNTPGLKEGRDFTARLGNGKERIYWKKNRSIIRPSATTPTAGHGKTLDLAAIDEAFAHTDLRADQSFGPPMLTRPEPQTWITSTAGTWESVFFNAKRKAGRQSVERPGSVPGMCFFEWSAPDNADLWDRDVWRATHPALGLTITEEALEAEIVKMLDEPEKGEAEARRAYYNQTRDKQEVEAVISAALWDGQKDALSRVDRSKQAVLSLDMPPDRDRVALGVAGWRSDGQVHLGLLHDMPRHDPEVMGAHMGSLSDWAVQTVVDLFNHRPFGGVAIDPAAPAGSFIGPLQSRGIEVISMSPQKHAQACGSLLDRLKDRTVWHLGQPELAAAAADAKQRPLSDAWAWDRRSRKGYISPLVAVTLALGGLLGLPQDADGESSVYDERGLLDLSEYV